MRIVISGTVGVGKTTTATNLKQRLQKKYEDVDFILELPEKNVYLDMYYKNRPEWSFLIQMDFLMARYRTLLEETERQRITPNRIAIFDRHFLDDIVFAKLNSVQEDMSGFQFAEYLNTNKELASKILPEDQPDYFILLKVKYDEVLNRIKNRGRDSEQEVDEAYWKDLYYQYYENPEIQEYFKENSKKYIILDIDGLSQEEVVEKIEEIVTAIPETTKEI